MSGPRYSSGGAWVHSHSRRMYHSDTGVVFVEPVHVAPIVRPFVPVKMAEADIAPAPVAPESAPEIVFTAAEPAQAWTDPLVAEPEAPPPASNPDFEDFVNTAKRAGF